MKSYEITKLISFIIRYALCFFTIEKIDIFADIALNYIFSLLFGGVIYKILIYTTCPIVSAVEHKLGGTFPAFRSAMFCVFYIPQVLIIWFAGKMLLYFGVFPIHTITFEQIFETIFNWYANKIVDTLFPTAAAI